MSTLSLRTLPWEAFVWLAALVLLALYDPYGDAHLTVCPFALAGIDYCPGCGLGRSISYLFKGDVVNSLSAHPLGIFAVFILTFRIVQLTFLYFLNHGKSN